MVRVLIWLGLRVFGVAVIGLMLLLLVTRVLQPPWTPPYITTETARLGEVRQTWVPLTDIALDMRLAAIAAEDANFCIHFGFDLYQIRAALGEGGRRGASTISQQVVKNLFLWQDRSWTRKGLEGALTPMMELLWPKRRILEFYLNIAEFDEGVFGVEAAAQWYFGVAAADLSMGQAAALAAVLPNPKDRSASRPTAALRARAGQIIQGARTVAADGRSTCIED